MADRLSTAGSAKGNPAIQPENGGMAKLSVPRRCPSLLVGAPKRRPLASAFEAKYAIKVSYARADSQVNILKMLNELKAGRVMSDIFGLNTGEGRDQGRFHNL